MYSIKSANEQAFKCVSCKKIHLEFGHFSVDFPGKKDLQIFLTFLQIIDGPKFEEENNQSIYRRKISVPMEGYGIKLQFTKGELIELQSLISNCINQKSPEELVVPGFKKLNGVLNQQCLNQ